WAGPVVADDKPAPKRLPTINELNETLQKPYGIGTEREVELPADKWLDQIDAKGIPVQFDLSALRRRGVGVPDLAAQPIKLSPSPNITVGEILRYVLEMIRLDADDGGIRLTYRVQEGKVLIVPETATGAKLTTASRQHPENQDNSLITMTLAGKTLEPLLA